MSGSALSGVRFGRCEALSADQIAYARSLVIWGDDEILIIEKPAGLPTSSRRKDDLSLERLAPALAKGPKRPVRIVHRLDRPTSGLMVLARTQPTAAALSKAFAERQVDKRYLAAVAGAPEPSIGRIDAPLRKTSVGDVDLMVRAAPGAPGAKPCETHYETLATAGEAALVSLEPRTGRMHQLRAHLALIGHAILGDEKYGGPFTLNGVGAGGRLHLHAHRLAFDHPVTGERLSFERGVDAPMRAIWTALGFAAEFNSA